MAESILIYFTVIKKYNIHYSMNTRTTMSLNLCIISKLSSFFWSPVINAWWYTAYCAMMNVSLNLIQSRGNANYPNIMEVFTTLHT